MDNITYPHLILSIMTSLNNPQISFEPIKELLGRNGLAAENIEKIITVLKPLKIKKGNVFSEVGKRTDKLGILIDGLLVAKYEKDNSTDYFKVLLFTKKYYRSKF